MKRCSQGAGPMDLTAQGISRRRLSSAFGLAPARFDGVEPWAFGGQGAEQNPYPFPCSLDLTVMFLDPLLDFPAKVPGGIVPQQEQRLLAQGLQLATDPRQESGGHPTDRAALHKAQPDLLLGWGGRGMPAYQQSIAGQGLGVWVIFGNRLLHQTPGTTRIRPGVQAGVSQPAKPGLILEAQSPVWMSGRQANQSVPSSFFSSICWAGAGDPLLGPRRAPLSGLGWLGWSLH